MSWEPTTRLVDEWGHLSVIIDGVDVTFWRDTPAAIESYRLSDPFGHDTAVLRFPSLTPFDVPGDGSLAWLRPWAKVDIAHVKDDEIVKWVYGGLVASIDCDSDGWSVQVGGAMSMWLSMQVWQPEVFRRSYDIGTRLRRPFLVPPKAQPFSVEPNLGLEIGKEAERRGSRSSSALQETLTALEWAQDASGGWTYLADTADRRAYVFQHRDLATVHHTVHVGSPGVDIDLSRDGAAEVNRIYGEGVAPNGARWRNTSYSGFSATAPQPYPFTNGRTFGVGTLRSAMDDPEAYDAQRVALRKYGYVSLEEANDASEVVTGDLVDAWDELREDAGLTSAGDGSMTPSLWATVWSATEEVVLNGAYFRPLARKRATEKRAYDAAGNVIGDNPDFDPDVMPVERFVSFPEGTRRRKARNLARSEISRTANPQWRGTITLTIDPQDTHRLDIQAGQNIRLRGFGDTNGKVFHIAGVTVSAASEPISVALEVDTLGRPLPILRSEIRRERRRRSDPAWTYNESRSRGTSDALIMWDQEAGAGEVPETSLTANAWNVVPFVGGEAGSIGITRLNTDPAAAFSVAVFGDEVSEKWLDSNVGDPTVTDFDWDANSLQDALDSKGLLVAWGADEDLVGYGRKIGTDDNAELNGRLVDDARWGFFNESGSPFLWLAVWPTSTTTMSGRFKIQFAEAE